MKKTATAPRLQPAAGPDEYWSNVLDWLIEAMEDHGAEVTGRGHSFADGVVLFSIDGREVFLQVQDVAR